MRRRVLFFAEAVTLAHVARPMVLAQALDPSRYDVFFACDPRFLGLFGDVPFAVRSIKSMSSQRFLQALRKIAPLFSVTTLRAYVKEDLEVIQEIRPDLIVGDFRMSLPISAPAARCPHMLITNAYWSPFSNWPVPLPDGFKMFRWIFKKAVPWVYAWHAWPINRLRREYGLPTLPYDFRHVHISADHVLYPDVPEMTPIAKLPPAHHYIGPIFWQPHVALPDWWRHLPADRPIIYVALGSSGREELLPIVFEALANLQVSVIVATAGKPLPPDIPANAYTADYLPGKEATARAALVICNGGSPASHQALALGTPVLGLASNIDQYMNMDAVCRTGAGEMLRAETATVQDIRGCVTKMLAQPEYGEMAARAAKTFKQYDAPERFRKIVDELFVAGSVGQASEHTSPETLPETPGPKRPVQIFKIGEGLPPAIRLQPSQVPARVKTQVRRLMKPDPTRFFMQMTLAWAIIVSAIGIAEHFQKLWLTVLMLLVVATRQNVLGLLVHEQVHLLGVRSRGWADILTNFFCAFPLFMSVESYGNVHLSHHRFFFTDKDPDYHRKQGKEWTFPQQVKVFLTTLFMDITGLSLRKFIQGKRDADGLGVELIKKPAALRWVQIGYYIGLSALFTYAQCWSLFLFYWVLPLATALQAIVRWGAIVEHKYNLVDPTVPEATPLIEPKWWEKLLLPNLNFSLHIYHHYWPSIPASKLPVVHQIFKREGLLEEKNVFHGNWDYLKFLFTQKR